MNTNKPARGEQSHFSKLTALQVAAVREMLATGIYQKDIAKRFDVSRGSISCINTGTTWQSTVEVKRNV
jgi:transposase